MALSASMSESGRVPVIIYKLAAVQALFRFAFDSWMSGWSISCSGLRMP